MQIKTNPLTSNHQSTTFRSKNFSCSEPDELNRTADELHQLARKLLPDNVLSGLLRDREQEIRQDAILLALDWRFRDPGKVEPSTSLPWLAPRALAAALKFTKLRYKRLLAQEHQRTAQIHENSLGATLHHFDLSAHQWPEQETVEILRKAIQAAVRDGQLSHANAVIATRIYVDHESVAAVAASHKVHRSAIYQRLGLIKGSLRAIIDTVELPYCG